MIFFRYWIREGDYSTPKSCLDIMFRGFSSGTHHSTGSYKIEPTKGALVKTQCDFDRHGGGWTLLVSTHGSGGWDASNILERNMDTASADEYSIYKILPNLQAIDPGEVICHLFFMILLFVDKKS